MTIDKGILIRNIYYMLTYAFQDLRQNNYDDISGEKFDNILDLFAEILFIGVSFQLKRGLHKDYIPESDDIATVKGKIALNDTIRLRLQRKKLMACEFDNFTEDNIHNRIIKSTLSLLVSSAEVKTARKGTSARCCCSSPMSQTAILKVRDGTALSMTGIPRPTECCIISVISS